MDFTLHNWQKKTIAICKERKDFGIFAKMGTGKTCTAIQIFREICNKQCRFHRTLVLGPVAVVFNWKNEFLKFSKIPEETIFVSTGTGESRKNKLARFLEKQGDRGIVVTNYESLRNTAFFKLLKDWRPEIIFFDESHMIKTQASAQAKLSYILAVNAEYRYLLTGTPIVNSPLDIYMQYKIKDLGATFGSNFFGFRARYFINENVKKPWLSFPHWVPDEKMYPELMEKMHRSCIVVQTEECLDLPDRIEQTYHVEMSSEQKRLYKEMKKDFITFIKQAGQVKTVTAEIALTKALRLQQITTGFCQSEDGSIIEVDDAPRVNALKELLEQILVTDKCIVWCCFVHNYRQVERVCKELKQEYVLITGEQNAEQKQHSVDQFQANPLVRICIANRRSAGLGINLTAAAYSITYSRNFSLAEEEQASARNYRKGSEIHKKIVKIDLVSKGTIDEIVLEALKNKQKLTDILVNRCEEL